MYNPLLHSGFGSADARWAEIRRQRSPPDSTQHQSDLIIQPMPELSILSPDFQYRTRFLTFQPESWTPCCLDWFPLALGYHWNFLHLGFRLLFQCRTQLFPPGRICGCRCCLFCAVPGVPPLPVSDSHEENASVLTQRYYEPLRLQEREEEIAEDVGVVVIGESESGLWAYSHRETAFQAVS